MTMRKPTRRDWFKTAGLSATAAVAAAASLSPSAWAYESSDDDEHDGLRENHVFAMSNATSGNELLVYAASRDGTLSPRERLSTQGAGTGGGLGNQGAVTFSGDGRHLFVVNALSNSVATFAVRRRQIALRSVVDSGGQQPVSVSEHDGVVYVLNAAGAGNITGFRNTGGLLRPLHVTQPLSAAGGTGPAQVSFSPDGDTLLVTEKATNKLVAYRVRQDGRAEAPRVTASAGATPFGFTFDKRGTAIVSEAFGGAAGASAVSSYVFADSHPNLPVLVSASVGTTQSAACWVVATPDGRHAYVTNTASGTISRYAVRRNGQVALAQAVAAASPGGPIDAAISANGKRLFVLNAGARTITSFLIGADGTLTAAGSLGGLMAGANGLAAN